jgi:hypothetical protein
MQPLKESIDLDVDSVNELLFKVQVEGTDVAPARVRLAVEGDDVSYMFKGHSTEQPGIVQFDIPNMAGRLKEGLYSSRVEVFIDNRYFAPVEFDINFKQPLKVSAESIVVNRPRKQDVSVKVTPVIIEQPVQQRPQVTRHVGPQPVKIEEDTPVKPRVSQQQRTPVVETKASETKPGSLAARKKTSVNDDLRGVIEGITRKTLRDK